MFSLANDQTNNVKRAKIESIVDSISPEEVKKAAEKFFESINKKLFTAMLPTFTEDAELHDLECVIEGRTQIIEYFEKAAASWRSVLIYYPPDSLVANGLEVTVHANYSFADINLRRYISKTCFRFVFNANLHISSLRVHYDRAALLTQIQSHKIKIPVAIITGSASGLGAAIAKRYYEDGMHVVIADINEEKGRKKAEELQGIFIKTDVSEVQQVESLITVISGKYGRLDCLVNNAGITGPRTPIVGYPDDSWHKVLKIDLNSVYYGMKFGLRVMQKQGYGVIINMASLSGVIGYENVAAYTSSKAAIIGLTRSTALEAARFGVRVNTICPTGILTETVEQMISSAPNPEVIEKQFSSYNPLPGSPKPLDVGFTAK